MHEGEPARGPDILDSRELETFGIFVRQRRRNCQSIGLFWGRIRRLCIRETRGVLITGHLERHPGQRPRSRPPPQRSSEKKLPRTPHRPHTPICVTPCKHAYLAALLLGLAASADEPREETQQTTAVGSGGIDTGPTSAANPDPTDPDSDSTTSSAGTSDESSGNSDPLLDVGAQTAQVPKTPPGPASAVSSSTSCSSWTSRPQCPKSPPTWPRTFLGLSPYSMIASRTAARWATGWA